MENKQLKQALRSARMEIADLALVAQVDVKTVRRWIRGGRHPRGRSRYLVAEALGVPEEVLWPEPENNEPENLPAEVDLFTAGRSPDWRELLGDAQERVELLDLTLAEVLVDGDQQLLADAAARGCRVRVLLSDPDSVHLVIAEQAAGRYVTAGERPQAAAELERVTGLLAPGAERGAVELRRFVDAGAYQVLIFDQRALIRLRLAGVDPAAQPVLSLNRDEAAEIFDSFAQHFHTIWERSDSHPKKK